MIASDEVDQTHCYAMVLGQYWWARNRPTRCPGPVSCGNARRFVINAEVESITEMLRQMLTD